MKRLNVFGLAVLMIAVCTLFSCSSDDEVIPSFTSVSGYEDLFSKGVSFESSGGEKDIKFTTNVPWLIELERLPGYTTNWISINPMSGQAGTNTVHLKVDKNDTYDPRLAMLKFYVGDSTRTAIVGQSQNDAITIRQREFNLTSVEQDLVVTMNANVELEMAVEDADWISINKSVTRGLEEQTLSLHVAENTSYDDRSGFVRIKAKNGSVETSISITQRQTDIIKLDETTFSFNDEGGIFTVGVNTNVEYTVQILCDWIKETSESNTRALITSGRTFRVEPMNGEADRNAIISFYYPDMQKHVDVAVYQHSKFHFLTNTLALFEGDSKAIELFNETGQDVKWSSSNPSVASVNDFGQVSAIKHGTAIISASTGDGGQSCQCNVTVDRIDDYISCSGSISLEAGNVWKTNVRVGNSSSENVKIDRVEIQQNSYFIKSFDNQGYLWANSYREFSLEILTGRLKFIVTYSHNGKSHTTSGSMSVTDTGSGYMVGN